MIINSLLLRMKKEIRQLDNTHSINTNVFKKVTDNSAKSINYNNLQALIDDSLCQINNNKNKIENAKKLRDIYYAHSDKDKLNNIDKLFKKHKVSLLDIENLLVLNSNLCIALYNYFKDTTMIPRAWNYDDFKNTVHYLELGVKYSNIQLQETKNELS